MSESPDSATDTNVGDDRFDDRFLDRLASAADMVGARRFREAEVEVLRALSIAPSDLRALKLLGLVRFKLGRLDEARAVCREIAATLPRDAGIRLNLGLIALKMDRVDESVHELEMAARLAPDDLRAWSYLGFAYSRRGDGARAAVAFRRAGQDALAAEAEGSGLVVALDSPARQMSEASTRVEGAGSGPKPIGVSDEPRPGSEHNGDHGEMGEIGEVGEVFGTAAFDLSAPVEARGPGTDPDRPTPGSRTGRGDHPVSPLVGYVVSRLAPPTGEAAWVGSTARLAIGEQAFVRADAAVACMGAGRWGFANRHVRGRSTSERLGGDERPFLRVLGPGDLFVGAPSGRLVPLQLADDILYLREDRVLAFEGTLSWESGSIPRGGPRMLQFRGRGLIAVSMEGEPGAMKVTPEQPAFVSRSHLLGWMGRVVTCGAEGAESEAGPFGITCEGEGVVLVDVKGERRQ